ncbi:MAG: class I SAM-dependent methyltransferase [Planctomycetota bacterium]|nr:class I SAM-dependent methyltransferase [Planctomycetota bacterium]
MSRIDPFQDVYARASPAFGDEPSPEVAAVLEQCDLRGRGLDAGAGLGRHAIAMARRGLQTEAIDVSETAITRLRERAGKAGLGERIRAACADLRTCELGPRRYALIVAATVLDHLPEPDGRVVLARLAEALAPGGVLFVEVHTTGDPGFRGAGPASECAAAIEHYYRPGQLLDEARRRLRILRYEERAEWDRTHGPAHGHAKASLLAAYARGTPRFFGLPPRGPLRPAAE